MVRRNLLNAAFIAATLFPLGLISCSGDDSTPGGTGATGGSGGTGGSAGTAGKAGSGGATTDGGTSDAKSDTPTSDTGTADGRSDAGPMLPDGSVPPSGTQLVPGSVTLAGVTSDNYAVYVDDATAMMSTISLAGGTPTMIGGDDRVVVSGPVVVTWVGTARVSALSVWTAAHGTKVLSMSSAASATSIAVSPDGAHIMYFDAVDAARTRGDLFIAGTDGSNPKQLYANVVLNDTSCTPVLAFGGNGAAAAALCSAPTVSDAGTADGGTTDGASSDAATADGATADGATADGATTDGASPDAGPPAPATVVSFTGANWTPATIATNVLPRVAVAPTGTMVLVSAPAGLLAYPIAGGAPTTIDAAGGSGMFTKDGLSVIYTAPGNALKRSTVASPSPVTLATTGFAGLRATSPDENWVLGYVTAGTTREGDLYLASTTTPGTPTTLSTDLTAGLFGTLEGFTTDSTHATYYTDVASGVGNFWTVPSTGGSPVTLGTNVWLHYPGMGAKVAFADNYDLATNTNSADIHVANTAQSGPPTLLVSFADADFFVAGSKDKVVYAWKYLPGPMQGLWVTAIP